MTPRTLQAIETFRRWRSVERSGERWAEELERRIICLDSGELAAYIMETEKVDNEMVRMTTSPRPLKKPHVKLGDLKGPDGNAFSILSRCIVAARELGWDEKRIERFIMEAKAGGSYVDLIIAVHDTFDVEDKNVSDT